MNDVKVHYNSDKPSQLQALAYTQGTDIHVAPGQKQHLPHEAWHVVQQKQGRVQPTVQLHGINVNDNEGLEEEANVMSAKAENQQLITNKSLIVGISTGTIQRQPLKTTVTGVTHLVQANEGSIYNGIQERALFDGQEIQVETSDKIRSRRGPNQEVFHEYDAKNPPEYRWVRVISVGDEDVLKQALYIRDDAIMEGDQIQRSREFDPSIDHRLRKDSDPPENTFASIDAPAWYEKEIGIESLKSSTAERKHRKLLAMALNCSVDKVGEEMRNHANDPDMLITLETIGQHMTHVTPWQPESIEADGKDLHEGYTKKGEYFRTSIGHPLHQEYEMYQQAMGVYEKDKTTQPVNPGWAKIASTVMGIDNMCDKLGKDAGDRKIRTAEHPDRIARGPGAVIGNEEMARETAWMRQILLGKLESFSEVGKKIDGIKEQIEKLESSRSEKDKRKQELKDKIQGYGTSIKNLKKQIGALKKMKKDVPVDAMELIKIKESTVPVKSIDELTKELEQINQHEANDKEQLNALNSELQKIPGQISTLNLQLTSLVAQQKLYEKYTKTEDTEGISVPRSTDLTPLKGRRTFSPVQRPDTFAKRLLENRRNVKLGHLFGEEVIGDVSDVGGKEHPNLILEKGAWKEKEDDGVTELQDKWKEVGLKTNLQVRGSFGHHRPSVSPLADGRVRINPGLYPMSLLQKGIGAVIGADAKKHKDLSQEDFMHREALEVAVEHALNVIHTDQKGESEKIIRIKEFAKHRLMINLLKAQTILKSPIPDPEDRELYLKWLENDFVKTAQVLENLNESTHLLLSARINEEIASKQYDPSGEPLLQPGSFRKFITETFAGEDVKVAIYYVASGMQAITTGAIAAVHFRRLILEKPSGVPAKFKPLHPYFEMRDKTAEAAGFSIGDNPETVIADLSPVDTKADVKAQSQEAVKAGLGDVLPLHSTLVPVLDATATPLDEVKGLLPEHTKNFIIVESLTKYAQLGSDKALGGRIIGSSDKCVFPF